MNKATIPIFIIVHDRIEVLKKSIESFEKQINYPIEIILYDVASTFQPCLEYLKKMEKNNYKIYRSEINSHIGVMNGVKDYLSKNPNCKSLKTI